MTGFLLTCSYYFWSFNAFEGQKYEFPIKNGYKLVHISCTWATINRGYYYFFRAFQDETFGQNYFKKIRIFFGGQL